MMNELEKTREIVISSIPPQSLESEQAVLGAILLDSDQFADVREILEPDDFISPAHRLIYAACLDLWKSSAPVDLITVRAALKNDALLEEVGGVPYLATLAETTVSTARAAYYASVVKEKAQLRRLITTSAGIVERAYLPGTTAEEVISEADAQVREIAELYQACTGRKTPDLDTQIKAYLAELDAGKMLLPIKSPWLPLNKILRGGILPGELAILAARPSVGKSAFALNWAYSVASSGEYALIFSLEMATKQLFDRLMANVAGVDVGSFREGLSSQERVKVQLASDKVRSRKLLVFDEPRTTLGSIRRHVRKAQQAGRVGLVVIDYLQLVTPEQRSPSREREVAEISRGLKLLAKEFEIPVLLLAQLNRKSEEGKREPVLSDLRESGSIEQDADIVMFLHTARAIWHPDEPVRVIVAKGRSSGVGRCNLVFRRREQRFEESDEKSFSMAQEQEAPKFVEPVRGLV